MEKDKSYAVALMIPAKMTLVGFDEALVVMDEKLRGQWNAIPEDEPVFLKCLATPADPAGKLNVFRRLILEPSPYFPTNILVGKVSPELYPYSIEESKRWFAVEGKQANYLIFRYTTRSKRG